MDNLTFDELENMVNKIFEDAAHSWADDEDLHARQDHIYELTLEAIMNGIDNPAAWAACALRVKDADFSRWYA